MYRDALKKLAQAVIIQAASEAIEGDESARAWLSSLATADTWLYIADLRRSAVLDWLGAGCPRPEGVRLLKSTQKRYRSS